MSRATPTKKPTKMATAFTEAARPSVFSRLPSYTLIYIPSESGAAKRLIVPKAIVLVSVVAFFALVGGLGALGMNLSRLKNIAGEYEKLKAENHSIRSEAAALVEKLEEVQSNLTRVDRFSDEVREAAQFEAKSATKGLSLMTPAKKKLRNLEKEKAKPAAPVKTPESSLRAIPNDMKSNVVPQTEGQPVASSVKVDNLEFKDLFLKLSDIEVKSSSQAQNLQGLLKELQGYRALIGATPTISPVQGWVTSMYGWRSSPFGGQNKVHQGLDIAAPLGTPIRTAADGKVIRVSYADDYGRYVEISHGYGIVSRYAHAQSISVKVGDSVKKGDTVGAVGMTGRTTGPHLHYEIELNGRKVDPSNFIRGL